MCRLLSSHAESVIEGGRHHVDDEGSRVIVNVVALELGRLRQSWARD